VGLSTYGPYDENMPGRPRTCDFGFMYPSPWEKLAKEFKNKFLNGYEWLKDGFKEFFRLDDVDFKMYPVELTENGYKKGIDEVLGEHHNMALVLVSESMKLQELGPYWLSKGLLTNKGLPSQMLTIETISSSVTLKNSIVNLASQIYAKLGGIPWVLHDPIGDVDIIVGVGKSEYQKGRFGSKKTTIGFTTVYKNNGAYLWFDSTPRVSSLQSLDKDLSEGIVKSVKQYEKMEGMKVQKVVIHSYKKIGNAERLAVKKLKESRGNMKVILSHLDRSHNLRIFDPDDSNGVGEAGLIIQLGDTECLVLSTGRGRFRGEISSNRPIWVKTYPDGADFEPVKTVAKSAYDLCYVYWKDQFGAAEPITMRYSMNIAQMLERINSLEEEGIAKLTSTLVDPRLRKIPWFI
jgi:argonaute-like protein implicated in RNA metabolism and viral defense